jgi:uncharacterized RDD family membrane protein YckC
VIDRRQILTPEKAILSFQPASLGSRIIAGVIDLLAILAVFTALSYIFSTLLNFLPQELQPFVEAVFIVLFAFVLFIYFWFLEYFLRGRTLGKMAAGLRVMMADGTPITAGAAFLRSILILADYIPLFIIGLAAIFTNERAQRLGDMAAGTIVFHEPKRRLRSLPSPHRAGIHPFEPVIGDLRSMSIEEYGALRRLADRLPALPAAVQKQMLDEIWTPFALRHRIHPLPGVHPLNLVEAAVTKYGREKKLL